MTRAVFPARCAVAVACGEHLVSQVYPAAIPIEMFIDDAVALVAEELKRRGADGPDPDSGYELHRANGTRLDVTKTLDELGIDEGSTLVLSAAAGGESFEPHYESLSTSLAKTAVRLFPPVTERTATQTAVVILGFVATAVVGLAWHVRASSESMAPAAVAGGYGCILGIGALWVRRWWPQRAELLSGLGWLAVPPMAFGAAATAPGGLGSAHLFIGVVAVFVATLAAIGLTGRNTAFGSALATLCVLTAANAGIRMWRPVPESVLGTGTLVGLLFLLTGAPTVALWSARLRPPHFGSVTGRDLFRRNDGMPVDAVAPVEPEEDQAEPDSTPRGAAVVASAVRANAVLTGMCVAAASALPIAIWSTVRPDRPHPTATAVLGGVVVLAFISRARAFADRRQAVALVCGAAAGFCAGVARHVMSQPGSAPLAVGSLVLVSFGAAGLAAALLVPATPFTPLVRMVAEWLELVATAAALPLAAWIGGLFTWVRMR